MAQLHCQSTHKPYLLILRLLIGHSATSWLGVHLSCLNIWLWVDLKKNNVRVHKAFFGVENMISNRKRHHGSVDKASEALSGESAVRNIFLPSPLPLRVTSDEVLSGWEPKESKLSRESSLLCPHPPSSVWWLGSSRSEYQLSPKPLSLPAFGLDVSCRACVSWKKQNQKKKNGQTMSIITFISRSPR